MTADEMIVRGRIPVETIRSNPRGKLLDLADFRKQVQVAVDGSKADIRKFLADIQINGLGGRAVSYTHLDVYKRQARTRKGPKRTVANKKK